MAHANRIRILVLHDDPIARAGLAAAFRKYHDLEIVNADDELAEASEIRSAPSTHLADVVVTSYESGQREIARRRKRKVGLAKVRARFAAVRWRCRSR